MNSPLVRTWLAARLPDLVDRAFYVFHPSSNVIWDEYVRRYGDLPGPAAAGLGSPVPALNLLIPCKTCGAHANAPCVNADGEPTGPHKSRRDAATAASTLTGTAS